MKKRILSFLLVVCMLLSMVPVMAAASEQPEAVASDVESANADYAKLYVQAGLVHAYMAFGTSDASYDIAGGVWYDLVGNANATINGGAYSDTNPTGWKVGEFGGLVYEDNDAFKATGNGIVWTVGNGEGQLNLPETFTVEYLSRNEFRDVQPKWHDAQFTTSAVAGSTDTLYSASVAAWRSNYGKLIVNFTGTASTAYEVKINGAAKTVTMNANGTYAYSASLGTTGTLEVQAPAGCTVTAKYTSTTDEMAADQAFAFGSLRALVWTNTLGANSWGNGYGSTRWFAANRGWLGNGHNCSQITSEDRTLVNHDGRTVSMTVVKKPYEVAGIGMSESYTISYGSKHLGTASYTHTPTAATTTVSGTTGTGLLGTAHAFRVQAGLPGAVYSLRIYDCTITPEIQAQNHFVDIMAYARYDIEKFEALDDETKTALYTYFADAEIEGKNAGDIDSAIARIEGTVDLDETLYVQDGLVSLFLADNIDITNAVWYNAVEGGANATLKGYWFENADGSVHVNKWLYGTVMADGSSATTDYGTKISSNWDSVGSYLDLGITNLPDSDFTVSATASYKNLQSRDFITGAIVDGWTTVRTPRGGGEDTGMRLSLGFFRTNVGVTGVGGQARWYYTPSGWQQCGDWGGTMTSSQTTSFFKNKFSSGFYTETVTRDETVVSEDETKATYTVYQDASKMIQGTYSSTNAKAPIYSLDESTGAFQLFKVFPADVISVAVYEKALTPDQMKQNHAADIVEYYDLDISSLLKPGKESAKAEFIALAATFALDSDNYLARKEQYQASIATLGAAKNAYDSLYVVNGLIGLYTIFDADEARDVLKSGVWSNKIEGGLHATVKGPAHAYDASIDGYWGWQIGENGGLKTSYTRAAWKAYVGGKNSTNSNVNFTGLHLNASMLDTATGESTVEFVGTLEPIVNANGTLYETNASLDQYGVYNSADATFALGYWKSTSFLAKGHGGASFGQDRWSYHELFWANHNGSHHGGVTPSFRASLGINDIVYCTFAQTNDAEAKNSTFKVGLNLTSSWSATSDGKWYSEPEQGIFKLLNGMGGSVYAVRVYDRTLTDTEMQRNHFVDILAYYKIDTALVEKMTEEQIALGAANYAQVLISATSKNAVTAFVSALTGASAEESLYVIDGLVGLFTAYNNDDTVDLGAGKWINKAGGQTINLAGAWTRTENGAITNGPMTYGRADYVDNYYGGKVALRDTSKYNTWTHTKYVDLGIAMLPTGDYSIEIVSEFYETMLLTDEGERVPYQGYTPTYWYNKTVAGVTTVVSSATALTNTATDTYELIGIGYTEANGYISNSLGSAIGNLKAFTSSGGRFEGNSNYCYRWYLSKANGGWGSFGYGNVGTSNSWEDKSGVYSTITGSVQTKLITREMTYENEALTSVTYGMYRNSSQVWKGTMSTDSTKAAGTYYPTDAETVFYLFKNEEVDLYSIRIYDKVLSIEEQIQNRAADVIAYYDLDLSKYNDYTDELKAQARKAMADLGFTSDKASAQAILDGIAGYSADSNAAYDAAYVQNGLVALFTAYGAYDASVDLVNGIWNNKVAGGADAVINGGAYFWTRNVNGGLYFNLNERNYENAVADTKTGIKLSDSYADLDAFTVEAVYKTIGLTNRDGSPVISSYTAKHTDANGVEIPASGKTYGHYRSNLAAYRFGMLNAFSHLTSRTVNDNNILGMTRWFVSNQHYNAHTGAANKADLFASAGQDNAAFYAALASGTHTYAKATSAQGVTYTMGRNGYETVSTLIAADKYATLSKVSYSGDNAGYFSLFNAYPAEVYAIRVYNRALTAAEYLQNHFVDMAAYFGLDISLLPADDAATVYAAFENVTTETSPSYAEALYGFYVGDKEALAGTIGSHEGYAPLLGDESGYRVLFGIEKDAYDLFASGYTINYGAIVAIGEWGNQTINTMEDLTVTVGANGSVTTSTPNAQVVVVGGTADGSNLYYEDLGDVMIYSVSVTADATEYGAGVLVRGFYTITNAKGQTMTYYMEPAEDGALSGAVSVLEAADYYVNKYDGNVALAYEYMNCASMLKVLDACGVTARTGLGGDLTFYVEADGSDENNGLSKNSALATVGAAFAAAKAHMASANATGVVIEIGEGEFFVPQTLTMDGNDFGANAGSVVIRGQGDATVLTGAVEIDTSAADADNSEFGEYIINLTKDGKNPNFRYLYANGEIMDIVSAGSEENYFSVGVPVVDDDAKTAKIYMDPTYINADYDFVGTEVHLLVEWNFNIIHVVDVDVDDTKDGNVAVYVDYDQFKNMAVYSTVNNREFWLANGYGLLANAANEGTTCYYYDEKTGNLHIFDENFDSTTYSYAGVENMFVFSNIEGLVMEDLSITGVDNKYVTEAGGLKGGQAGSNGKTVEGTLTGGSFLTLAAIHANNISNSKFEGLNIYNVGGDGINLRGIVEDVEIVSNKIQHVGETAIRIGANNGTKSATAYNKDIVIANNYINGTGEFFKQCCGMLITNGANLSIVGNTITNTTYTAISIGWKWNESTNPLASVMNGSTWNLVNVEVAYNYISNIMTCMRDGGAVYILGGNAANDVDSYFNFLHDNYLLVTEETGKHDGGRWFMGYYHDGASSNWYDYNNVVVNATTSGVDAFVPYYVQGISGQLAHNVKLYGNYAIGFADGAALYRAADRIDASRNIKANDYIFTNTAMSSYNAGSVYGHSESLVPPSNAKALVHSIFLTAGSSLTTTEALGNIGATGGSVSEYDLVFAGGKADLGEITDGLEAPKYAVTIESDGIVLYTYEVDAGATFTMPAEVEEPTKARGEHSSFVFAGWKNYTEGMAIVSNITIEAMFDEVIDMHKVTLMVDGEVYGELEVPYGAILGDYLAEVETPVKEMSQTLVFTFRDWYDANSVETGFVVTDKVVEGDMTIYGLFAETARSYKAVMYVKDLQTGELVEIGTVSGAYGKSLQFRSGGKFTIYAPDYVDVNKTEYDEFMAQYMPADTDDIKYSYSNRMVLLEGDGEMFYANSNSTADYTLWTVRIREDDTKFILTFDESYRVTINGEEQWIDNIAPVDFNAYVADGYKLVSVTVNGEAVEDPSAFVATADVVGADIQIVTEKITYEVTFTVDGEVYKTVTVAHGDVLALPADPEKSGYIFTGWEGYEEGMIITGAVSFEANFEEIPVPEYAAGDLDGNGRWTSNDVTWLLQVIEGNRAAETLMGSADLDGNGRATSNDVTWLLQIIEGARDGETLEPIA